MSDHGSSGQGLWESLDEDSKRSLRLACLRWQASEQVPGLGGKPLYTDHTTGMVCERVMPAEARRGLCDASALALLAARTAEVDRQVRLAVEAQQQARMGRSFLPAPPGRSGDVGGEAPPPPVQVVSLGAGLDSRPWRLAWPPGAHVWEVDTPAAVGLKRQLLAGLAPGCNLWQIESDLTDTEGMLTALLQAGLQLDQPVLWLCEGLLGNVTPQQALALLQTMFAGITGSSSRGVMTMPSAAAAAAAPGSGGREAAHPHALSAEEVAHVLRRAEAAGWAVHLVGCEEQRARYGVAGAQQVLVIGLPPQSPLSAASSQDAAAFHAVIVQQDRERQRGQQQQQEQQQEQQ